MTKALLIGAGGVGTVGALALTLGGAEVTVVVRSLYDHVTKNGYDIDSVFYGKIQGWKPAKIVKDIEEAAKGGPYDYIVVVTKYIPEIQKTEDLIKPVVTPGSTIVIIQNGIGNEYPVMDAYPEAYVLGGVSVIGSANRGGAILHTGIDKLDVGTFDKRPEAVEKAKEFAKIYSAGGKSHAQYNPDLLYRRWVKLVYNGTINPVAALTGCDVGRLFFAGLGESVVYPAMAELRVIAETEVGKKLPEGIEKAQWDSDEGYYFKPSMLVDVEHERPMEIEAIVGNVLRFAKKHNIDAPFLKVIYSLLRAKQFAFLEKQGKLSVPEEPYDRDNAKPMWTELPWN